MQGWSSHALQWVVSATVEVMRTRQRPGRPVAADDCHGQLLCHEIMTWCDANLQPLLQEAQRFPAVTERVMVSIVSRYLRLHLDVIVPHEVVMSVALQERVGVLQLKVLKLDHRMRPPG